MEKLDVDVMEYEERCYGSAGAAELEEMKDEVIAALADQFMAANKDGLDDEDLIECIVEAFKISNDRTLEINAFRNNYTHKDLEDLSFEDQMVRIFKSEGK